MTRIEYEKILSIILSITMLLSMATAVFAEEKQNYEYILPMEYIWMNYNLKQSDLYRT